MERLRPRRRNMPEGASSVCLSGGIDGAVAERYPRGQMKALVKAGRLVLDEPTELPEGTVVMLRVVDEEDELGVEERQRLHDALGEAWRSVRSGHVLPVGALLAATSPTRS
jgi:hypothetical protein